MTFDTYIGIDYSGAEAPEPRLKGLQVYAATGGLPQRVVPFPEEGKTHWNWSRKEIAGYTTGLANTETRSIVGIDHGFSFPLSYFQRHGLQSWDGFLDDFVRHWPTHEPHTYVDFIRYKDPDRTPDLAFSSHGRMPLPQRLFAIM